MSPGMYYNPDEGFTASSWLATFADAIHNDYLDYWEQQNVTSDAVLSPEQRKRTGLLVELGEALRPCLHTLTVSQHAFDAINAFLADLGTKTAVGRDTASLLAPILATETVVQHGLEIALAREAADELLANAAARFQLLVSLIASRTLSQRAAAYLDRATRLYLWGFEPEAIIMCAASLEAAYPERFTDADMVALQLQPNRDREYAAWQYEQAAATTLIYDRQDRISAGNIRRARNDVVHNVPAVALTAKDAIMATAGLLAKLFPPESPEHTAS